jgi:hypothetical protein
MNYEDELRRKIERMDRKQLERYALQQAQRIERLVGQLNSHAL